MERRLNKAPIAQTGNGGVNDIAVVTASNRVSRERIVEEAVGKIGANAASGSRFPSVRSAFGDIAFVGTVNHSNVTVTSWGMFASVVLAEVAAKAQLPDSRVFNVTMDSALPRFDTPPGHRPELGPERSSLALLDGDRPYGFQAGSQPKTVNGREVREYLDETYLGRGAAPSTIERIEGVARLFDFWNAGIREVGSAVSERLAEHGIGSTKGALKKVSVDERMSAGLDLHALNMPGRELLAEFRGRQYNFFSQNGTFASEIPMTAMFGRIADALQALEAEGYVFYKSPLSEEFEQTGHLKGLDRNNRRQPVSLEGSVFTFQDEGREVRVHADDVYNAIRNGLLIPTVPTFVLSLITAPEIPHLGGSSMKAYSPALIKAQAEWLGLDDPMGAPERLFVTTNGQAAFGVKFNESVVYSAMSGYISHGSDEVMEAIRRDRYIEIDISQVKRE